MPPFPLPGGGKSAAALALAASLVAGAEGLRTVAYSDPVGIPTICFGETRGVTLGDRKTIEECRRMLGNRLAEFSAQIDRCLTRPVPDATYAAFLSFAYNVGAARFCGSTLVRKANAGDVQGACEELPKWTRAAGIELPGLVARRQDERALCLQGAEAAGVL